MSEVEIVIAGKNLAKAAFASASADVDGVRKRAADLALQLRRSELAAASAGNAAQRAFATAAAAADKAAMSAKAAADAQGQLARGEISAEDAAKADAAAQNEAAAATDRAARAALAAERASIAQAGAAKKAGEESAASADLAAAGSGKMAAGMEKLSGVGKAAFQGLVVGAAAVGVESIKAAMKFDQAMELIHTQAGVAQNQIKFLSGGVLHLAGVVGQDPDSLATALYHIESAFAGMGISGQKALDMVKIAAEGARVGNANLEDVTNALTAAVSAQIPGVQDLNQAMGVLNATVGAGDMKMQDLAEAFGTGMVAVVKGYGLSITDVGAALAVFGDNNIRGAQAGTQLRMAVQALAKPAQTAGGALKELGMTSDQMAKDMQTGGLNKALTDLVNHMNQAGIGAKEQGQIITELFGKKAGTGVAILVEQFQRLQGKYKDLKSAGNGFASAWNDTQKQFSTAWGKMEDAVKALAIQLGEKLIPKVTETINWFGKHTTAAKVLAGVIGGVLLVAIAAYIAEMTAAAIATVAATWPVLLLVAAVALVAAGLAYAYTHSKTFKKGVDEIGHAIKTGWNEAFKAAGKAIKSFENGPLKSMEAKLKELSKTVQKDLKDIEKWWKQNGADVMKIVDVVWKYIMTEIGITMALIKGFITVGLMMIKNEWRLVWGLVKDIIVLSWNFMKNFVTGAIHAIANVITLVSDLIHGRWSKLWGDVKRLVTQYLHDTITTIKGLVSNFGTLLWDAGANLIKGLISGIKSMIGAVGSTMSGIASTVRSYLPFSPAKTGPLSGEGSPDKAGAKISQMLADGMTANSAVVTTAASNVAGNVFTALSGGHHRRRGHHAAPRLNIDEQLNQVGHAERHESTRAVDRAIEKIMAAHRLTVAQLTHATQILLAKGGHNVSTSKIDGLVAEMKKHYRGLTSAEILKEAISELEKHPRLSPTALMADVAKALDAQARTPRHPAHGGVSGGNPLPGSGGVYRGTGGSWTQGGVQYTVTGPDSGSSASAASSSGGSGSGSSGSSGGAAAQTLDVKIELEWVGGHHAGDEFFKWLKKNIRVRAGTGSNSVQKALGPG